MRIHWTYYNKVKQIDSVKLTPPKLGLVWATKLRMKYDALGNRIVKENPRLKQKEVYVRDAQGNVIALYEVKQDSLYSKEFYIYGSQRLGYLEDGVFLGRKCKGKFCNIVANPMNVMPSTGTQKTLPTLSPTLSKYFTPKEIVFGKKRYELTDWLGNVRVVINDRKTPINTGTTTVGYKAQVMSVRDYYGFGGEMAERSYDPVKPLYRFGFNTQEKVFELNRDHYTAKFWEYDGRLGRRWNVDPKPSVGISEYVTFADNPIFYTDWLGDIPPELLVRGGKIVSSFNVRKHPITGENNIHTALDIAANIGEQIHAYASGKVVATGYQYNKEKGTGWGNYIVIEHKKGVYSLYAHLSQINVKVGDLIKDDQVIGKVGTTGGVTGPHLHIEIGISKDVKDFLNPKKSKEQRIDPLILGDLQKQLEKEVNLMEFVKQTQQKIKINSIKNIRKNK